MNLTIHCVTLPVDNIQRSFNFYNEGLGLSGDIPNESDDHVAFSLQGKLYLVIILRHEFAKFTVIAGQTDAPKGSSECILSYFTESRDEVDTILQRVTSTGGIPAGSPKEQPWGYSGYFRDPDGHLWEVMYNPGLLTGGM